MMNACKGLSKSNEKQGTMSFKCQSYGFKTGIFIKDSKFVSINYLNSEEASLYIEESQVKNIE